MKDIRLQDVLSGREDNYLLPFYWQHGDHREKLPEQIQRIYDAGCRALCVESRPHPNFCRDAWWEDMDIILSECQKRDMKVWILDDKHFPTGYANGQINEKYPQHKPWVLNERHVDTWGPQKEASFLLSPGGENERLLCVVAYRREEMEEVMSGEPILLTSNVHGGMLYWDVPDGCYRIFFVYQTRNGIRDNYIDMLSTDSVDVLINEVYESHYAHYSHYFGNTLAGFFSDEPELGNGFFATHAIQREYDRRIGQDGLALPYTQEVLERMSQELGCDASPYLAELWYHGDHDPKVRLAYMNAVTTLYKEHFCDRVGNWCRAHDVMYIGHVIEDNNNHARLGHGTGHYFRSLSGQDMGGIDVVLHQVMPGFAHHKNAASCSGRMVDTDFFHYVLAKLGASIAHQHPHMQNRAMCEVFGAYGWAEGSPFMKWLMDFLLVRGINHFVPHAFSPTYPDPDCPPHFGAEGHDPQFDGFSAIMRYTNKAAHLLTGGVHIATAAILYHAEMEWMNPRDTAMLTQVPARTLYDAHIDYDIVSIDSICEQMNVKNGKLILGEETFACLVIPYAPQYPTTLIQRLEALKAAGAEILFVDQMPVMYERSPQALPGVVVSLQDLPTYIKEKQWHDLDVEGEYPLLRLYHVLREGHHVYMLFNESPNQTAQTCVCLPTKGSFARFRLIEDEVYADSTCDGRVSVTLLPGQSEIWVFDEDIALPTKPTLASREVWQPEFDITIAHAEDLSAFAFYTRTNEFFNLTSPKHLPDFCGKVRYTFDMTLDAKHLTPNARLSLGKVGQTAILTVNGQPCGIRVCQPYDFEVGPYLVQGVNTFEVEVANTLVAKTRDYFSYFMTIPPTGLMGPITFEF